MFEAYTADTHRFELAYQENTTPWDIHLPQPAIVHLAENEKIIGDVLDLGCGTGENALMVASRGHVVWGIDSSHTAIQRARKKSQQRELNTTFIIGSALELDVLGEGFHTIIDCGLFHIFDNQQRELYLKGLQHVMQPHAYLYLLCFSDREPGDWGPRRIKRSDLRQLFTPEQGFRVQAIVETRFFLQEHPQGAKAWLASIERLADE